jgi:hypothetical protein
MDESLLKRIYDDIKLLMFNNKDIVKKNNSITKNYNI